MPNRDARPYLVLTSFQGAVQLGGLAGVAVLGLVILLNPAIAADAGDAAALTLTVIGFYVTAAFVLALPAGVFSLLLPSLARWLRDVNVGSALHAALALALAFAYRDNALSYRFCVPEGVAAFIPAFGAVYLGIGAAFFLAAALGPRGRWLKRTAQAAAVAATAAAFALSAVTARGTPRHYPPPTVTRVDTGLRVYLLGVDAIDPGVLKPLTVEGAMPHLAGIMADGAWGELETIPPGLSPAIWTTIATGSYPRDHGVADYEYLAVRGVGTPVGVFPSRTFLSLLGKVGLASLEPYAGSDRRVPALWNVASAARLKVGVAGWHTTTPAEIVNGVMVSDSYHSGKEISYYPPAFEPGWHLYNSGDAALRTEAQSRLLPPRVPPADPELFYRIYAEGRTYEDISRMICRDGESAFTATYFNAVDAYSHLYWRYRADLGLAPPPEINKWGRVVDEAYIWADEYVGEMASSAGDDAVVIVVSDHGFETATWARRTYYKYWQGRDVAGVHDVVPPPPGFVALAGGPVRRGVALRGATVLDVAPNVLYLLGLPVARDMPGKLWLGSYDDAFVKAHPPRYIPTYRGLAVERLPASPSDDAVREKRSKLKALGYLR